MSDITQISLNGNVYNLRDKKWLDSITNCITEIPQDINLELSSGTLTLKTGSKAYRPNGAGVFTPLTAAADRTVTSTTDGTYMLCSWGMSSIYLVPIANCFSGTTQPSSFSGTGIWYDTTNNVIKATYDGGSTWDGTLVFPMAIITVSSGAISSIDQVFNGFGYIGSTIFALPGVKGLAPNGRNTDGTLKNTAVAITSVQTANITSSGTFAFRVWDNNIAANIMIYNESDNYNYINSVAPTNIRQNVAFGKIICAAGGVISSFISTTAFHAVDYNDSKYIANCAMPSDKYDDLTLPASGATVTAPADGYIVLAKKSGAANEYISISGVVESIQTAYAANETLLAWVPVSKGQTPKVFYNATGTTIYFKFVYANGAK